MIRWRCVVVTHWRRVVFFGMPVLWVLAAHIAPLVALARISLLDVYPGPPDAMPSFSLSAYTTFLAVPGYRASLLSSLELAVAVTVVALLLSYPLAYYVARCVPQKRRGRRLMLLVAPFWTSEVLRMFAVVLLLANRGALNVFLRWTGLTDAPIPMLYGASAVLAGVVYTVMLSMLLPLYAALDRLPADLLDAATDLGAGPWQRFWNVTLPLTSGGVISGATLTFLASLGVFAAPALLGGAGTPVFAITIADLFGASSGRWPAGAAFGFILLIAGTASAIGLNALPHRDRRVLP